jgi:hypothetical protein
MKYLPEALLENDKCCLLTSEVRGALVLALLHMFSCLYYPQKRSFEAIRQVCFGVDNKIACSAKLLNKLLFIQAKHSGIMVARLQENIDVNECGLNEQSLVAIQEYTQQLNVQEGVVSVEQFSSLSRSTVIVPRIYAFIPCQSNRLIFNDICLRAQQDPCLGASCSSISTTAVFTPTSLLPDQ